jgi:hypothetical protein
VGVGIGFAVGVSACSVVQSFAQSLFFFTSARGGLRAQGAINVSVYRKALRLSVSSVQKIGAAGGSTTPVAKAVVGPAVPCGTCVIGCYYCPTHTAQEHGHAYTHAHTRTHTHTHTPTAVVEIVFPLGSSPCALGDTNDRACLGGDGRGGGGREGVSRFGDASLNLCLLSPSLHHLSAMCWSKLSQARTIGVKHPFVPDNCTIPCVQGGLSRGCICHQPGSKRLSPCV